MESSVEGSGTEQEVGDQNEERTQQTGEGENETDSEPKNECQQKEVVGSKTDETQGDILPNGDTAIYIQGNCIDKNEATVLEETEHDSSSVLTNEQTETEQDSSSVLTNEQTETEEDSSSELKNGQEEGSNQREIKEADDILDSPVSTQTVDGSVSPKLQDHEEQEELDKEGVTEDCIVKEVRKEKFKYEDFGSSVDPSENSFFISGSSVDGDLIKSREEDKDSEQLDSVGGYLSKNTSVENKHFVEDLIDIKLLSAKKEGSVVTETSGDEEEVKEEVIAPERAGSQNASHTEGAVEGTGDVLSKFEDFFITQTTQDTHKEIETDIKVEEDDRVNSVLTADEDKAGIELSFTTDGDEDASEINLEQSQIVNKKISEKVKDILGDSGDVKPEESVQCDFSTDNGAAMPEKQEEMEEKCPDLTKARCRYRWAKTIPTQSAYVMFFCTVKMEEPVKLLWTESSECFYSDEREVPCGVYHGNLVIDGRTYPVEDLTVKHYTFEVDIYVRDDVIDDEIESRLVRDEDEDTKLKSIDLDSYKEEFKTNTGTKSGIHLTSKYEDLIRQQLNQSQKSMDNLDSDVDQVPKTDQSLNGHESPILDLVSQKLADSDDRNYVTKSDIMNGTAMRNSFSNSLLDNGELENQDNFRTSPTASGSPVRHTPQDFDREGHQSPLRSTEAPFNRSGLNTPIMDVIGDVVVEQRTSQPSSHHSSARHTPQQGDSYDDTLRQDQPLTSVRSPTRSPIWSPENTGQGSPKVQDFVGDVLGQSTPVTGSARQTPSKQMSAHSSARQTPTQIADVLVRPSHQENGYKSTGSYNGSLSGKSPVPLGSFHGSAEDLRPSSYQGSLHGSPAPGSFHGSPTPGSYHGSTQGGSVQGSYHGSAHGSPVPGSYHGSLHGSPAPGSYQGSTHGGSGVGSYHGSLHGSPTTGSYHGSAHVGSGAGSYHGSPVPGSQGPGSYHGSGGSRPQSLTSEQELSQYFEQNSRGSLGSEAHRTPLSQPQQPLTSMSPALSGGSADRVMGASSLPVLTTQQRISADISKRSMTPDNHIRVPGSPGPRASPLVTGAGSRVSSRASTRTITPTSANGYHVNGLDDTQNKKIEELEDNVKNLRQVLSSRELEIHELTGKLNELTDQNQDLKDELADVSGSNQSLKSELVDLQEINQSLKSELDHVRSRQSPGVNRASFDELERKYKQVMEEKEILASEVVKLRDKVEELELGISTKHEADKSESAGLSSYDPNNPYVLQRKIADLQSQVQDLQEANESAVAELNAFEKRCQELEAENDKLRTAKNMNLTDLQTENRRLHDKISTLWEQGYGDGDRKLRVEYQQLKDDNRALKERNYKLHEENLAYLEEVSKARKGTSDGVRRDNPLYRGVDRLNLSDRVATSKDKLLTTGELTQSYRSALEKSDRAPYKSSLQDRADERFKSDYEKDPERYRTDRLKNSYDVKADRRHQNYNDKLDKDDRYSRSALEKEQKIKTLLSDRKEDTYLLEKGERLHSSVDKDLESRFRSSLDKNTGIGIYKSTHDPDDPKYRYDQTDRLSRRDLERSKLDRSYADHYDKEMLERSRSSDHYRSRTDGGGVSGDTRDISLNRYDHQDLQGYYRPSDRSKSESVGRDRSLKDSYSVEGQGLSSNKEYKSLNSSYSELLRVTQKSALADKREWSLSEVDLRANRGRSKTPEPRRSGSVSSHKRSSSPQPVSAQSLHTPLHHPRASRHLPLPQNLLPRHSYRWDDDPHHRRSGSALSERSDSLLTSDYLKSQHLPPSLPSGSGYRPKDMYDGRGVEKDYDSLRKSSSHYHDDRGEESDTATDILVNAQPFEKEVSDHRRPELHRRHHSSRSRRRRDSVESETDSSPEDIDEQISMSLRKRSKSADGRELLRRSLSGTPTRSNQPIPIKSSDRPSFSKTTPLGAGFRTVTPSVLTTQHNKSHLSVSSSNYSESSYMYAPLMRTRGKHSKGPDSSTPQKTASKAFELSSPSLEEKLTNAAEPPLFLDQDYLNLLKNAFGLDQLDKKDNSSLVSLTSGLRPFAPRTPADINLEDVVKFSRQGGKLSQGVVKYVGHLPGRSDVYLGVELDKEDGKHDGTFEKTRYFKCKPNKGVFVAFNKVVMAWAP